MEDVDEVAPDADPEVLARGEDVPAPDALDCDDDLLGRGFGEEDDKELAALVLLVVAEEVDADKGFAIEEEEEVFEEEEEEEGTRPGELGLSSEARLALRSLRRIPGARGPSPDI